MPDRPGLDDDAALKSLIGAWRDGAADLDSRLLGVFDDIRTELALVGDTGSVRLGRLRKQADRLVELRNVADSIVDDLTQQTSTFIDQGGFARVYQAGAAQALPAGQLFSFTLPHREAVAVFSRDTFADVLAMTDFVSADARDWVARVSRDLVGFKLTSGTPVKTQARRFERDLRREFHRRGIGAVTYRDGSRHSFGEYAEMLMRTKTGVAYNAGTLNQGRQLGVKYYELLDGASCGLTSHHDPELANGLIVTAETAAGYPLAHPNCRRAVTPRPDITDPSRAVSVQAPEAREDQRRFEEALRRQGDARRTRSRRRRGRSRPSRASRGSRPTRPRRSRQRRSQPVSGGVTRDQRERLRARAERLRRRDAVAQARQQAHADRLERQAADAAGGVVDPELLARWGVTEEQYQAARTLTKQIRADIKQTAADEADSLGTWLFDNDLSVLTRPARLRQTRDPVTGRVRRVRDDSGYDFLEQLDDAELARVRRRYTDSGEFRPDVVAEQVRRKTGLDLSDDEAIDWLVERWLHEDGLRSLASGRIPRYANPENLIPGEYSLDGYEITRLFGVDDVDAIGHVARVQADAAEEFARRVLGQPSRGPAPWEMDFGDWLRELEDVETVLSSTQLAAGVDPGDVYRFAQARVRELVPADLDPTGTMNPAELWEEIRQTARLAGLLG